MRFPFAACFLTGVTLACVMALLAVPACLEAACIPAPRLALVRATDGARIVPFGKDCFERIGIAVVRDRCWPPTHCDVSLLHCTGSAVGLFGAVLAVCKNSELNGVNMIDENDDYSQLLPLLLSRKPISDTAMPWV